MFTVVTQIPKKQMLFRAMKLTVVQQEGTKFYVVSVRRGKRVNWKRLERILGNTKCRVVCSPELLNFPPKSIQLVDDIAFSHMMTRNALRMILEHHREFLRKKAVCFVDVFCRHQAYADILMEYFAVVYIITNRHTLYLNYQQAKFYETGATILVDASFQKQRCNVCLFVSPDGIVFPQMEKSPLPMITAKSVEHMQHLNVYHSFCSKLAEEYAEICPSGISTRLFQAALYEYCGLRHLSKEVPAFGMKNYEEKSIEEIIFHIFSIDT